MHRTIAVATASTALVGLAYANTAHAQTRDEVARHYAPTIFQETSASRPRRDFVTAFDYDCDWNGDNNRENIDAGRLPALVYYAAYETDTHWFVHYMPYHPTDDKVTNGHEHDTESVLVVVRRSATPFGALEVVETRFHTNWYQYARVGAGVTDSGDNVDGPVHLDTDGIRPTVYQQAIGHGICGGFAPPCRFIDDYCDLAITCNHSEAPHLHRRGVIYRYDGTSPEPRAPGAAETVIASYDLVPIEPTLWAHRMEIGPGRVYGDAIDYNGSRCAMPAAGLTCPRGFGGDFQGNNGSSPGAMWAQEGGNPSLPTGEVFFDPAYAMSRRLAFPAPFSLSYSYNPYVGIGPLPPVSSATICDLPGSDAGVADTGATDAASDAAADVVFEDVGASTDGAVSRDVTELVDGARDATPADVSMARDSSATMDVIARDANGADAGPTMRAGGCGCHTQRSRGRHVLEVAALAGVALALRRRR